MKSSSVIFGSEISKLPRRRDVRDRRGRKLGGRSFTVDRSKGKMFNCVCNGTWLNVVYPTTQWYSPMESGTRGLQRKTISHVGLKRKSDTYTLLPRGTTCFLTRHTRPHGGMLSINQHAEMMSVIYMRVYGTRLIGDQ